MKLTDLRIIVTGAASGMGRHFALRLAECGASVLGVDLSREALADLETEAEATSGSLETCVADVTLEEDVSSMVDAAVDSFGKVNGLVNCAGLFRDALLVKRDRETGQVKTMSLADWRKVIDVDLTGPFLCTRAVAARMIEMNVRPGVVVNISSVSRHGNRGQQ